MNCVKCGKNAPTKKVKFMGHVGLIFFRFDLEDEGRFCKSCVHASFFKNQAICMVLGWWGIISFFVNFTYVCLNFIEWVFALGMKSTSTKRKKVKPTKVKPTKVKQANAKSLNSKPTKVKPTNAKPKKPTKLNTSHDTQLRQLAGEIRRRLRGGEKAAKVSADIAHASGIPQQAVFQFIKKHYKQLTAPRR